MDDILQRFGEVAVEAVRLAVGDRLAEHARRADFVARTGENEFGIPFVPRLPRRSGEVAAKNPERFWITCWQWQRPGCTKPDFRTGY